jgi:hypothetical protein
LLTYRTLISETICVARLEKENQHNEIFAPLRGAQLKAFVEGIRSSLYNERVKEKKDRYNEAIQKYV